MSSSCWPSCTPSAHTKSELENEECDELEIEESDYEHLNPDDLSLISENQSSKYGDRVSLEARPEKLHINRLHRDLF